MLNVAGFGSVALLICAFTAADPHRSLPVSMAAGRSVNAVARRRGRGCSSGGVVCARSLFSNPALVGLGKRSYGVYLWSWPISVICGAYVGSWTRFIAAMSLTIVVSEFSYVYIETPIRKGRCDAGSIVRATATGRREPSGAALVGVVLVGALGVFFSRVDRFDRAAGGQDVAIDLSKVQLPAPRGRRCDRWYSLAPGTSTAADHDRRGCRSPSNLPARPAS